MNTGKGENNLLIEQIDSKIHKAINWQGIVRGFFQSVFLTMFCHAYGILTPNCGCARKITA